MERLKQLTVEASCMKKSLTEISYTPPEVLGGCIREFGHSNSETVTIKITNVKDTNRVLSNLIKFGLDPIRCKEEYMNKDIVVSAGNIHFGPNPFQGLGNPFGIEAKERRPQEKTVAQNCKNLKVWYDNGRSYTIKNVDEVVVQVNKGGDRSVILSYRKELTGEMLPGGVELEYRGKVVHKVTIPRELISWIDYEDEKGYGIEINNKVLDQ